MLSIFSFLFSASLSFAGGNVVSNGGSTIRCPSAKGEIFSRGRAAFDIFDAHSRGMTFRKLASFRSRSLESAFPAAVDTFFSRDERLKNALLVLFARPGHSFELARETLPVQPIFSVASVFSECDVEQAAVLFGAYGSKAHRTVLKIEARIWSELATDQKIAILTHEYLQMVALAAEGSCAGSEVWALNGFFLSDQAIETSREAWRIKTSRLQCEFPAR